MTRTTISIAAAVGLLLSLVLASSAPSAQAADRVRVYTDTLTVRMYDWQSALIATALGDPIYPYPRLDFDKVGGPRDIALKVIVLESASTRLTIAPELGGRILRWYDKRAQREVLYVNPVIKPTQWGYRGWWLATGGIEWAFPTNEHGLNEWRPWQAKTYSGGTYAGVTVSDRDDRTGLEVAVTIGLYANDRVLIVPRISNHTTQSQSFQFWINAMLPYAPEWQFKLPAQQVEVHSTGDETLPEPGQKMNWPIFNGRDFSHASEWHHYLGVFAAPTQAGRASVVNPTTGAQLTRTFPAPLARGVKLFLLGDLPADLYTDGDSRYFEMWGGYTRTFNEDATLVPGRTVTWPEWWTVR